MKVPDATGADLSASFRRSAAGGGGNTKGKRKKPSPTPKPVPSTAPNRKIASPRQNRRMSQPCVRWSATAYVGAPELSTKHSDQPRETPDGGQAGAASAFSVEHPAGRMHPAPRSPKITAANQYLS